MRLVHKDAKTGDCTLIPEHDECMWHAYNLIQVGDTVRTTTMRKVKSVSATGSSQSDKVRMSLCVRIDDVQFDTDACIMRARGKTTEKSKFVSLGSYHTLELELNRKFTLCKDEWDSQAKERLRVACDPQALADVAAVVMQDGLAFIMLITNHMTVTKEKVDMNIPKKSRHDADKNSKGKSKFYKAVLDAIQTHVRFSVVKCVILASPGFVRTAFHAWMLEYASANDVKPILENKEKFLLVHTTSGYRHSLKEALEDPQVKKQMGETKAFQEVVELKRFNDLMLVAPDKAYYGYNHVLKATATEAVESLLISDMLFRSRKIEERKKYIQLTDDARAQGASVFVYSSMHESGKQLSQLSGVAAILRYPMPELDEVEMEHSDESSDSDSDSE